MRRDSVHEAVKVVVKGFYFRLGRHVGRTVAREDGSFRVALEF